MGACGANEDDARRRRLSTRYNSSKLGKSTRQPAPANPGHLVSSISLFSFLTSKTLKSVANSDNSNKNTKRQYSVAVALDFSSLQILARCSADTKPELLPAAATTTTLRQETTLLCLLNTILKRRNHCTLGIM